MKNGRIPFRFPVSNKSKTVSLLTSQTRRCHCDL